MAQDADHVADVVERRPRGVLDRGQRPERARGLGARDPLRARGLQRDLADPVRERVVHADRDPRALLGDRRRGRLGQRAAQRRRPGGELRDHVGAAAQQPPEHDRRPQQQREEHGVVERRVGEARRELVGRGHPGDRHHGAGRGPPVVRRVVAEREAAGAQDPEGRREPGHEHAAGRRVHHERRDEHGDRRDRPAPHAGEGEHRERGHGRAGRGLGEPELGLDGGGRRGGEEDIAARARHEATVPPARPPRLSLEGEIASPARVRQVHPGGRRRGAAPCVASIA